MDAVYMGGVVFQLKGITSNKLSKTDGVQGWFGFSEFSPF